MQSVSQSVDKFKEKKMEDITLKIILCMFGINIFLNALVSLKIINAQGRIIDIITRMHGRLNQEKGEKDEN